MQQNTPEWLAYRRTRIGASDAPIIMNVSPWKTPYQLWCEKIDGTQTKVNFAMQRGKDLESKALALYCALTGFDMQPKVLEHAERSWQIASLDGITQDGTFVVEIKCAGKKDHELALNNQIPEKYRPQLQHQMCVANLERMHYFSFDGIGGVIVEVKREDRYLSDLIAAEEHFYTLMQNKTPPNFQKRDQKKMGFMVL